MITLATPAGDLTIRTDRLAMNDRPFVASAGLPTIDPRFIDNVRFEVEGDRRFDPPVVTVKVRVSDPADPAAYTAWRNLMEHARAATELELPPNRVMRVAGLADADSVHRGTWWDVTLTFLPLDPHGTVTAEPQTPDELPYLMAGPNLYLASGPNQALVWTTEDE